VKSRGAAASRRNSPPTGRDRTPAAHQIAVELGAAPLRREIELLAQRGRLRLEEPVDTTVAPTAPSSAASLGLTQREVEVLALVAEGRTNRQIGQALFITPGRPAFTSHGSWPSWGSPVGGRRPRSPTGSASTNNDPLRPWPLFLGVATDAAGQSAARSGPSHWQRRPGIPRLWLLAVRLAVLTSAREVMRCTTAVRQRRGPRSRPNRQQTCWSESYSAAEVVRLPSTLC
jgi:hypothetical protein